MTSYEDYYHEGDEVEASIVGTVLEVGTNYLVLKTEFGDELQVNNDWNVEVLD